MNWTAFFIAAVAFAVGYYVHSKYPTLIPLPSA